MRPSCTPASTRPQATRISSFATCPVICCTSEPLPGKTHDAKAFDDLGLTDTLRADNSIGDKGFIGTGPTTPFRKPPGGELLDWQKEFNTAINKIRHVIERAIANFKTWRCMFTDYRRATTNLHNRLPRRSSTPLLQTSFCISLKLSDEPDMWARSGASAGEQAEPA